MIRSLFVVLTVLGLALTTARGQEPPTSRPRVFDVRIQLGFLPLYGGDATVGGVSTWIPSVGLGYRLPVGTRRTTIEAAFADVGQDRNPYNRAPAFTFVGLFLRQSLRAPTAKGVQPFMMVGIGRLRVDAEEIICEPPTCFREGGPSFVDGTFTTLVGGAGLLVPFTDWGALRGDLRLLVPRNPGANAGDSGDARPEFAVGLVVQL